MGYDEFQEFDIPEKGISYRDLKERRSDYSISYGFLLRTEEWLDKRAEIVNRDDGECQDCGHESTLDVGGAHVVYETYKDPVRLPDGTVVDVIEQENPVNVGRAYHLQVHHKYYVEGWLPWRYPNTALLTLCQWCHQKRHDEGEVPTFMCDEEGIFDVDLTKCSRCGGSGYIPKYKHVKNGICFKCSGGRYM